MSLLDYFHDMTVTATPIAVTESPNSDGEWEDSTVSKTALTGLLYNVSAASRYFNKTWAEEVSAVFATKDITNIEQAGQLIANGVTYEVDSVEDPGSNNLSGWDNVYLIGLKVMK